MNNKFLSALCALAAIIAAAFAPAPASAQVMNNVDNATNQVNGIVLQGGLAVALANSSADNAVATALDANIGNSSDMSTTIENTSYHAMGYGAVGDSVKNAVNQTNLVGAQVGISIADADSKAKAAADATTVNLGNTSSVMNSIKTVTSRH
jgi:hypothetical protein